MHNYADDWLKSKITITMYKLRPKEQSNTYLKYKDGTKSRPTITVGMKQQNPTVTSRFLLLENSTLPEKVEFT
ncbi:hypothetical protein P8452_20091 [Trifolium repens]|nr:hypothetical protein P8452_20091 [Trifolium repens]